MRLIDADKLQSDLKKYMKVQEETARQYNITDGTYVKLQRAIILTVMEMVQKQPDIFMETLKREEQYEMNNFRVEVEWMERDKDDPFRTELYHVFAKNEEDAEKLVRKRLDNYRIVKVVGLVYETD